MQATPLFLSACALASIAGIVSGTTINTRIIQHAGIGMDEINRPAIEFDPTATSLSDQVAPPDHYALNTPAGRFEVAELSNRGLYAQRRFGWREARYAPPPPAPLPEPIADPGWSYGSAEELDGLAMEAPPARTEQAAPTPASQPPASGQPRLIVIEPAVAGA